MEATADLSSRDQWKVVREIMRKQGAEKGEWAGFPLPHDEFPLILEKRYPFYEKMNGQTMKTLGNPVDHSEDGTKRINWWRTKHGCTVNIMEDVDGKRWCYFDRVGGTGFRQQLLLQTIGVAANEVWDMEAEEKALTKLKELTTHQQYKTYYLCGNFIETSKRSKIIYIFRKLAPTLAYAPQKDQSLRLLAALCMHPTGFYSGTFAGAHVPTDDVISHLLFMRADEVKFWGKCNHHTPGDATAGV